MNMPQPVRYQFTQRFSQPARKAYEWCTDFTPEDQVLMGNGNATREVRKITESTFILTDTYQGEGEPTVKHKLVCLYPDRLMWTSTHLKGPAKHSQFIYEITAETETSSSLRFSALHIARDLKGVNETVTERLAEELRKEDSDMWKDLAKEMEKELSKARPPRSSAISESKKKPFDLKALASRLEKVFPTNVKLNEDEGCIWVMDKVKLTEKGVVEGYGSVAERAKIVYRQFLHETSVRTF
jgi:uncharacterized membrane protein